MKGSLGDHQIYPATRDPGNLLHLTKSDRFKIVTTFFVFIKMVTRVDPTFRKPHDPEHILAKNTILSK